MASATQTSVALFASSNDGLSLRYGREGNYKEEHLVGFTVKAKVSERKNNLRVGRWVLKNNKRELLEVLLGEQMSIVEPQSSLFGF